MRKTFLITLLFTCSALAQPGLTQDQIVNAIAAHAQKLYDTDHFSGVVLVAKDGKVLLSRGWGSGINADMKFNIGSINKVFTKTAIQQLATAGKLSLDATVRRHLPDYPSPVADRITIRQLLEHRSGLGDFFGPRYREAPPARLRELSDFLPLFVDQPLQFDPGTSQHYSNAGYIVLGLIIERLSGEKYRDYVQKHIFDPAGMKNSGFWAVDEKVPNRATGYTMEGSKRVSNQASLPGRPSSAGGAYATAGDLLRFFQWTRETGIGVAGGAPGLNAAVEIDNGWSVVTLANYDPPSAETLARGAMQVIRGRVPSGAPRIELSGPVAVPLTPAEHLMAVEAKVNGKGPFHFVIDTGSAAMLRLSPEIAKSLGLEEIGEALSGDPSGRNAVRRPVMRVDSVEIGGARFSGVTATVGGRPGPVQLDGVIGLPLFGKLTVTLDYPRQELRLGIEPLPAHGTHVVSFTAEHGVPQIEIDVAGVTTKVDIDSGSPALVNLVSTAGLSFNGEPRVVGRGRTASNEFEIRAGELRGDIRVAGWTQSNPMVDLVDIFPVSNLGSRFLRQYVVTFDLANGRMELAKAHS
jgi:CubicO group peptidase (beta-lactamase class C family)